MHAHFQDKMLSVRFVQVDLQKRFLVYQMSSVYQAAGTNGGWALPGAREQSQDDWERGIMEIFGIVQGVHFILQFLNLNRNSVWSQTFSLRE